MKPLGEHPGAEVAHDSSRSCESEKKEHTCEVCELATELADERMRCQLLEARLGTALEALERYKESVAVWEADTSTMKAEIAVLAEDNRTLRAQLGEAVGDE